MELSRRHLEGKLATTAVPQIGRREIEVGAAAGCWPPMRAARGFHEPSVAEAGCVLPPSDMLQRLAPLRPRERATSRAPSALMAPLRFRLCASDTDRAFAGLSHSATGSC